MVTVGFCAILVGLGVDFAILIYGRYQQARSEGDGHRIAVADAVHSLGRAVFFGALTTAVGFLALVLSNSSGFIQLGVLIAIGISAAGLVNDDGILSCSCREEMFRCAAIGFWVR